jgi:hypothetical protein
MNQYCRFGSFAMPEITDAGSMNISRLKDWAGNLFVGFLGNVVSLKILNATVDLRVGSGRASNDTQQASYMDHIPLGRHFPAEHTRRRGLHRTQDLLGFYLDDLLPRPDFRAFFDEPPDHLTFRHGKAPFGHRHQMYVSIGHALYLMTS